MPDINTIAPEDTIPSAYVNGPFCASCDRELEDVDSEGGNCHACGLHYPTDDMPVFLEDDATPCGHHVEPCSVATYMANHPAIAASMTVVHYGCPLPAGHRSDHYGACTFTPTTLRTAP